MLEKTLRKLFASVSVTALLLSAIIVPGMGVNYAQAQGDWWQPFFDVAEDLEISSPGDASLDMTRFEFFQLALNAGLVGGSVFVEDLSTDHPFDGVPSMYDEAVGTLYNLGVVQGREVEGGGRDIAGDELINKLEALKILLILEGLAVQEDEDDFANCSSDFGDVPDWGVCYVMITLDEGLARGNPDGSFGSSSNMDNAVAHKLTLTVLMVTDEDTGDALVSVTVSEVRGDVVVSGGNLLVELSGDSPSGATLPLGAMSVTLALWEFTASADGDITLSAVKFSRNGVGVAGDFANVYAYLGDTRLRSGKTISTDTNTVEFTSINVLIPAGTTVLISIRGDIAVGATPSNQHAFSIASADDISSNASGVDGTFPTMGGTFLIGGVAVSTVIVATAGSISKPVIGQSDAEVANFKLTAGNNDISFTMITLTNGGTISSDDVTNFRLLQGVEELAIAQTIGLGDRLVLVLVTPYTVKKNQNRNFEVHADILGGKTTDSIQFYLDEDTDIVVIDEQYGYGATITNNLGTANVTSVTMQGGKVTIADNGPTSSTVANNTTQVVLFNFTITGEEGRSLTIRDYDILLVQTASSAGVIGTMTTTNPTVLVKGTNIGFAVGNTAGLVFAAGDVVQTAGGEYLLVVSLAGGTLTVTPRNSGALIATEVLTMTWDASVSAGNITNLKLIDLDSGASIYTANTPDGYTLASDDWDLSTRHMSIQVDTLTTLAAGNAYQAGINMEVTNYIKDNDSNEFLNVSDIVGGNILGKVMTIAANSLTISQSSIPTNNTYVKGSSMVDSMGVSLTAGDAGPIYITKLTIRVMADSTTTFGAANVGTTGDTDANTLVSTVALYHNGNLISGPVGLDAVGTPGNEVAGSYRKAEFDVFDGGSFMVPDGTTETLIAVLVLRNTATGFFYLNMLPDTDIEAEDSEGNTLTAAQILLATGDLPLGFVASESTATSPFLPGNPGNVDGGALITMSAAGTLQGYVEGEPDAEILVAGSTNVLVNRLRFHANNESWLVKKLTVVNDVPGDNDFQIADATATTATTKVTLRYTDIDGNTQTTSGTLAAGIVTFSGLTFYVPIDSDAYLEILVDVSSIAAAGAGLSGQVIRLGILDAMAVPNTTQIEVVGQSSSATINTFSQAASSATNVSVTGNGQVNNQIVRKTRPTFAVQSASTVLSNGTMNLIKVKVTADSAGSATLARLVFTLTANGSLTEVNNFQIFDGSSQVNDANIVISYNAVPANPLYATGLLGLDSADGTDNATVLTAAAYSVVITFDSAQTISSTGKTYTLKADVAGAGTSDSISTKLAVGDESAAVAGLTDTTIKSNLNANTGFVATATANAGLFATNVTACTARTNPGTNTNDGEYCGGADLLSRNIIWSDQSSDTYSYPSLTAGDLDADTVAGRGSDDFTNGFLLDITNEPSHTLTY